jgi:hypothetical protein
MARYLDGKPYPTATGLDFLEFAKDPSIKHNWTRIIMNPPFSQHQDVRHIVAAYDALVPGGILVSVVSPSPFFRTDRLSTVFRAWLDARSVDVVDVPEGAFKASGTMIRTKIIKVRKEY